MTQATTNPATVARHDDDMTHDTTLRQHTVASITLESGSTKRTVQRWVAKCGDIGALKNNVPHFSEAEKVQILSHQSNRATEETIEAELVEPGAIELHTSAGSAAAPLVQFNIQTVNIQIRASETEALNQQSAQFKEVSHLSAKAIADAISAEFNADLAQVRARQKNLINGIEAQALANAAQQIRGQ
ncbi:MAG: hypothetical protein ACR2FS_03135 [Phormidesmis sp.]